jgi:hypothetical protein
MNSLALLQQSNSSFSFLREQSFLAFSEEVAPVLEFSKTFSPVWPFDESNTGVILKHDEPEQREINVDWEETSLLGFTLKEQLNQIFVLYTIIHEEDVRRFLENNEFLIPLVFSTFLNIKKYFSCSKVTLDVETDYEYPSHRELAAHVVTSLSLEEALQQLEEFDDHWWLLVAKKVKSKLYVDLRFE